MAYLTTLIARYDGRPVVSLMQAQDAPTFIRIGPFWIMHSSAASTGSRTGSGTPDEFRTHLETEIKKWGQVVKATAIRVD